MEAPQAEGSPQEEGGAWLWRESLLTLLSYLVTTTLDYIWSFVNSPLGSWSPAQIASPSSPPAAQAQAIQEHEQLNEEDLQLNEQLQEAETEKTEWVKVLKDVTIQVRVTGRTGDCEKDFLKDVADHLFRHDINLKTEDYQEDSGHFLLVFCPVVSRMGTDMQNAMEGLQGEPKAILVMLHHRPKEYNYFVDTKLQAHHPAVVHIAHARYTLEDGLYDCPMNKEAVDAVAKVLKDHFKEVQEDPVTPDSATECELNRCQESHV
nr:PREDICTED: uncharacterized protein LOC100556672 [Anolis carolinensis]|eukprot:XP_008121924.1 PREDICTED: uncharacterized protein LOC100556672 [Anolis carolinensis]